MAKVMISLPDDLLARIDHEARQQHSNRSAFLREAARQALGWPDPAKLDGAVARARAAVAQAGSFESAEIVRAQRDARHAGL